MTKPFYSFKDYLTEKYDVPLYRIPIDLALSCPHRNKQDAGCIFCSEDGARARHLSENLDLKSQVEKGIKYTESRYKASGQYIAYFQSFTSTHLQADSLRKLYFETLSYANFKMIIIATRPDCLPDEVLDLLSELNQKYELWIELGVQTAKDKTLKLINRGHTFAETEDSVKKLAKLNIKTAAHIIIGLPEETHVDYIYTIKTLGLLPFSGIKIHNLLVLKKSPLAMLYNSLHNSPKSGIIDILNLGKINLMNEYEYAGTLIESIRRLPPKWPLFRVNTDADPDNIIAPKWNLSKGQFLALIENCMVGNSFSQGDLFGKLETKSSEHNPLSYLRIKTEDNSYTFYNPAYRENYHSIAGAESEAENKFIKASNLHNYLQTKKQVELLDIGFGLGYNSLCSLKLSKTLNRSISITSLEYDTTALTLAANIHNTNLLEHTIINVLLEKQSWSDDKNNIKIILGDARRTIFQIQNKFDVIYFDGFSPIKNPELWTYDFLRKITKLLNPDGVIVTYSSAFPVRGALIRCGLYVGVTEPFGRKRGGTIAAKNKDLILSPLSDKDTNIILKSTAGIAYRDPTLSWSPNKILKFKENIARKLRSKGVPKWHRTN